MKYIHPRGMIMRFVNIFAPYMSDALYLRIKYFVHMGKPLHLKHPRTFNEKLQWLKLYNRRPEYTTMVDKVKAKEYVAKIIGEEHIIPTLGVWDSPDDIDFDKLPNQFVLKCNHDSGGLYICTDKSKMDVEQVKENLRKALNNDFFLYSREWPYKNVERKILAEKYMVDENVTCDLKDYKLMCVEGNGTKQQDLRDYKFYCFDGKVEFMLVSNERSSGNTKFDYFDSEFNHLPFTQGGNNYTGHIGQPAHFDEMIKYAEMLSKGIPHVRVDFYEINGTVYFGELTFFDDSGFAKFNPQSWDEHWGDKINLPLQKQRINE